MDFEDGVTLVDEEREMPELNRNVDAAQHVHEEPPADHQGYHAGQHAEGLERQPSIDSLLVLEETTSSVADHNGQRRSTYTAGNGSSISSQRRRLSIDSLHQEHSSEMEVSPMSSRAG